MMCAAERPAVFRTRGITKVYHMGEVDVTALDSVDLDLFEGELVVLLGPSGSGKSTLLNILGGLDVPTAGDVFYRDHDLSIDDDRALTRYRREHVGFVFQFYNLITRFGARWGTFVVNGGRAHARPLEIGHRNEEAAVVVSGLNAGDEVIVHPTDEIADGVRVMK